MRSRFFVVALALLAAGAGTGWAQETTSGSIAGLVLDAQGAPVPGATVTLTSGEGVKTYVTGDDGRFFAPYLTPGTYSARVELAGFSPVEQPNIVVRLGQRVTLSDISLKPGGIQEVVQVQGAPPVIDSSSTTVGGVLSSDVVRMLPVGRNFTDTLYLLPGVSDSSGVGRANPSIGGASGLENAYIVDGVNISNAGYGGVGTYSIVFGSLGTGVTTDFIQETQVKTAGFEAEFGQSTGGVVNVVTKSGTNTFRGSLFGNFRPSGLEAGWKQLQTPNGTVNTQGQDDYDYGAGFGGRIIPDRLFFFGTINQQHQSRTFTAPPDFPLASLGEVDRERRIVSYAGKVTYQPTTAHRIDFSAFGDPAKGDNGPQRNDSMLADDTGRFSELTKYGGHNQAVRYDGVLGTRWLVEGSVSRAKNEFSETPSLNQHSYTDFRVVPNRVFGGIGFYDRGQPGINWQFQAKSTHLFSAAGSHQIRYGVQYEDVNFIREFGRTGPPFTLSNGTVTRTGAPVNILADPVFGVIYRATRGNIGPPPETTQQYTSFFLQDTWQVGKRLTLRPGFRYEQQKLIGGDPPTCHADDTRPGLGDGTGALEQCEFTWDGNWGPRLGATYDVVGNGRSKLYGSFGRFYARIPNDLAARSLSPDAGISRADYFDADLTQPVPEGVTALGVTRHLILAGLHAAEFDPDAKSTYINEALAGFEFEVAPRLSLGVRYIWRDMPRILEDVGTAQMVLYDLYPELLSSVEYFITNPNASTRTFPAPPGVPQASFEDPVHEYQSVEITANKILADNWSLIASYRWAKLNGNFEGFYRSDNAQSDPAITSLFDFPTNDPSYTELGGPLGYRGDIRYLGCSLGCGDAILPNDRPHQFKLFGTYTWRDVNFGLGVITGSGRSLTNMAANPNYDSSGEIPVNVRGSGIDTVDGFRERAPMDLQVDFHTDYTVRAYSRRFVVSADMFNLFNRREPDNYDYCSDVGFQAPNANFGQPINTCTGSFPSYQAPFAIRIGVRFEF
jgi:Carboxypeptidase regulatory-like domain/TonB dependent receptor/TonB-dependent Receptor Plug Domain